MQSFSQFFEQRSRLWSAKKDQVISYWSKLQPESPIPMQPMQISDGSKRSLGEDGVRISGSPQFIAGILSKLKAIISYEDANNRLRLVYREIDPNRSARKDRRSFIVYINLEPRARPKKQNLT